ncbi:MAG TPA: hypothetical protein DEV81_16700 [Cyanobacteria bacterium UBA11049]|nr:hypothetical protein [Cyanobacteria bacterium UBA11049]
MRFIASISLAIGLFSVELLVKQVKANKPIAGRIPVIAAAGDIACDPKDPSYNEGKGTANKCRMKATSDLLVNAGLVAVLPLGDEQYEIGTSSAFQQSYDPTWGRVKSISHPVVGNHEYVTVYLS